MYFMLKMLASPLWIKRLGPYKIFHLGNSLKAASPQVLANCHGNTLMPLFVELPRYNFCSFYQEQFIG